MINRGEKIVIPSQNRNLVATGLVALRQASTDQLRSIRFRGFEAAELILVTQGEAVGSASAPSSSSGQSSSVTFHVLSGL